MSDDDRRVTTPKHRRKRLAKSELWLLFACLAEQYGRMLDATEPGHTPPAEWPHDDAFVALCRTYGLEYGELGDVVRQIAGELETHAVRTGYEDAWVDAESDELDRLAAVAYSRSVPTLRRTRRAKAS